MKITVIHGQKHLGSTHKITNALLEQLGQGHDIKQFYVNDLSYCLGCFTCIKKDEERCPHRFQTVALIDSIEQADIVIVESPNYCMGMTGQLKTFFDHMAYRWMVHRPHPHMKKKIGIAISTAAGAGAKTVTKAIDKQFFWWGIPQTYQLPFIVSASRLEDISEKKKQKLDKTIQRLAIKILSRAQKPQRSLKVSLLKMVMRKVNQRNTWDPIDHTYWESHQDI